MLNNEQWTSGEKRMQPNPIVLIIMQRPLWNWFCCRDFCIHPYMTKILTQITRWDIESFTKLLWNKPWEKPFGADWVKVWVIKITTNAIITRLLSSFCSNVTNAIMNPKKIMKITTTITNIQAHENGSRVHLAEPRHATTAITEEAIAVMENHKVMMVVVVVVIVIFFKTNISKQTSMLDK